MVFKGLYTAIITPFNHQRQIDEEALKDVVEYQIAGGVDGIVVMGTTGESPTIRPAEQRRVLQICLQKAAGRVQIIAGTGSNATHTAIEHSLMAQELGCTGLLQVNPYYNKPTQKGLFEHFSAIADAVEIPIMLYNIPGRTAVNLEAETVVRLSSHRNIVAVKEASGDIGQIRNMIESVPSGFAVLSGDDNITLEVLKLGGHGVVSVLSNLLPVPMRRMVDAAKMGNYVEATAIANSLEPLFEACFMETNPQPIKTLMALESFCDEVFRLPMTTMMPENKRKLLEVWERYKQSL